MTQPRPRFHLAFPVRNVEATRAFYVERLGARVGRVDRASVPRWIDFDFFGHQLSAHLVDDWAAASGSNPVDGDQVPCRHFGVILDPPAWRNLATRLQSLGQEFLIAPKTRFAGEPGEQSTFFVVDPSGNALEFKAFADDSDVFATKPA
ncbi:MAG: glyoxalase [Polyangiaceae bacterium]|nr:glyoxalase [Polyangiaceae bacterium]MCB9609391.1 glyoxalase [Polyangiaceae bacterium]